MTARVSSAVIAYELPGDTMRKIADACRRIAKRIDTRYLIGMRVFKTALAVFVCLVFSLLLDNSNIMYVSAVSAIIAMQPSHHDTIRVGLMRVGGTLLGGLVGLLCMLLGTAIPAYANGLFVLIIPFFIMLDLYICNVLRLQDAASISCIAMLTVATNLDIALDETVQYAISRVVDTTIGVVVATCINLVIAPREAQGDAQEQDPPGGDWPNAG